LLGVCWPPADGQERVMAIAVHCPNPGCAKIHQVKDKYAGTRGKCPLCGSWMYVPTPVQVPVAPKAAEPPVTVPALDESPPVAGEQPTPNPTSAAKTVPARRPAPPPEPEPVVEQEAVVEEAALLPEEAPAPRRRPRPIDDEEEAAVAEISAEEETKKPKPKRHCSWRAIVLLILATLGLGAFAAAPYLPGPDLTATGDFSTTGKPAGISGENGQLLSGAAGGVAFFALLTLLVSLLSRRMGFLTL